MPRLDELEGWYTTQQAAHAVGYSRQGVHNLVKDGKIRGVFVGKHHAIGRSVLIIDPKSIHTFLKEQEQERSK